MITCDRIYEVSRVVPYSFVGWCKNLAAAASVSLNTITNSNSVQENFASLLLVLFFIYSYSYGFIVSSENRADFYSDSYSYSFKF